MILLYSTGFDNAEISMQKIGILRETTKEVSAVDEQMKQVLELVNQPAFLAKDGKIVWCNVAARSLLLEGAVLSFLLERNDTLYSLWNREGTLQISLVIGGAEYDASVRATDQGDLFVANRRTPDYNATANAVVTVSATLRKPLQNMMTAATALFDELEDRNNEKITEASSQLNRSIYQFLRLCGQMSDGGRLLLHKKTLRRESTQMGDFFAGFIAQARPLVESLGLRLDYHPLPNPLRADVDRELLERGLYNLLSNALNYTPKGGTVSLSLEKQGRLLLVSITDDGEGISPEVLPSLFERFTEHSIGDSRWGIGLGLPMAREVARLHGGTLMVAPNPDGKGTKITFSLSLEPAPLELHSRSMPYDYCSGLHHGLVELSDVLDAKLFDPNQV